MYNNSHPSQKKQQKKPNKQKTKQNKGKKKNNATTSHLHSGLIL